LALEMPRREPRGTRLTQRFGDGRWALADAAGTIHRMFPRDEEDPAMSNALFAFDDRRAAERTVALLTDRGLAPSSVQLHARKPGPNEALIAQADELVTGGFVRNFLDLFQGIFDWGDSPHDASAYADIVHQGGAVVSVDARTVEDRKLTHQVMRETQPIRQTDWSDMPQTS